VMVAESGGRLLDEDAEEALRVRLLPRVTVVTPNVPEARVLAGGTEGAGGADGAGGAEGPGRAEGAGRSDDPDSAELARSIHALGPGNVVVTGGHRELAIDVFFDGARLVELPGERYPEGSAHGSGCTHSSALAAHLALGLSPLEAARAAKQIASDAVRDGIRGLGAGPGPVDVFALTRRARAVARGGQAATRPLP
jgi:hydroxymethylpyrimidine/phosphomethylpyrimidine kinase